MPAPSQIGWSDLFAVADRNSPTMTLAMRVLKRRGEPLLILPGRSRLAACAMDLYPAQTAPARLARWLAWLTFKIGVPFAAKKTPLTVALEEAFPRFLRRQATGTSFPSFAILAGNPHESGRRFVILVFGPDNRPVAVVKAGLGDDAIALITKERSFLQSVARNIPSIPKLRDYFESANLHALALDFIAGDSPHGQKAEKIFLLLQSWIDESRTVRLVELPTWQRLTRACADEPLFLRLNSKLGARNLHPAIFHGDFAPWNIKVATTEGDWVVLDWERGELNGVPAWDWFHFVLQPAILVEKLSVAALARQVDSLLSLAAFRRYAERAGILGVEHEWLLAYLLHCRRILKPSEEVRQTGELLGLLRQKWLGD
jgi:hypothetical protein